MVVLKMRLMWSYIWVFGNVKYLFIIVAIFPSPLTISFPSTSKMLSEFKPLFEKDGLTDFRKDLLSDTFLTIPFLQINTSLPWRLFLGLRLVFPKERLRDYFKVKKQLVVENSHFENLFWLMLMICGLIEMKKYLFLVLVITKLHLIS